MCNYVENCSLEQIFSCICNENISYCSDCYEKHKQSSDPDTIHSKGFSIYSTKNPEPPYVENLEYP